MSRRLWAVVLARATVGAKSRLAGVLSEANRRDLVLAMLADVLDACAERRDLFSGVLVVVDDVAARAVVQAHGGLAIADPGAGMNAAARAGSDAALQRGADAVIVLPADIPLLQPSDFDALAEAAAEAPRAVIVGASRDGTGTNALLLRPASVIEPAFGPPSVQAHLQRAAASGAIGRVCSGLGLALDIDTPADLAVLTTRALPPYTSAALEKLGFARAPSLTRI